MLLLLLLNCAWCNKAAVHTMAPAICLMITTSGMSVAGAMFWPMCRHAAHLIAVSYLPGGTPCD